MEEIWRPITGYEGLYEVSNIGQVNSLPKEWDGANGGKHSHNGKLLKYGNDGNGYLCVSIINKNGVRKTHKVHRLVAEAFIPNPENKPCINHRSGVKTNNRVENLEWVSYSENNQHSHDNNLIKQVRGCKHGMSKLTESQVREIKQLITEGKLSQREIGELYNVMKDTISAIKTGKTWKHI